MVETRLRDNLMSAGLSNRESEISELVSKGLSNREIGNQLFITEKTVRFHLLNIYKKLNLKSRAQLIVRCLPFLAFNNSTTETTKSESVSEYDRTLVLGNRLHVNQSIQSLSSALQNLRAIDSPDVAKQVEQLEKALKSMQNYNSAMVDLGIS